MKQLSWQIEWTTGSQDTDDWSTDWTLAAYWVIGLQDGNVVHVCVPACFCVSLFQQQAAEEDVIANLRVLTPKALLLLVKVCLQWQMAK